MTRDKVRKIHPNPAAKCRKQAFSEAVEPRRRLLPRWRRAITLSHHGLSAESAIIQICPPKPPTFGLVIVLGKVSNAKMENTITGQARFHHFKSPSHGGHLPKSDPRRKVASSASFYCHTVLLLPYDGLPLLALSPFRSKAAAPRVHTYIHAPVVSVEFIPATFPEIHVLRHSTHSRGKSNPHCRAALLGSNLNGPARIVYPDRVLGQAVHPPASPAALPPAPPLCRIFDTIDLTKEHPPTVPSSGFLSQDDLQPCIENDAPANYRHDVSCVA